MTTQLERETEGRVTAEPRRGVILVKSAEGVRAPYEGVTTSEELESLLDAATSKLRKQTRMVGKRRIASINKRAALQRARAKRTR